MMRSPVYLFLVTLLLSSCGGASDSPGSDGNVLDDSSSGVVSDGKPVNDELLSKCAESTKFSDASAGVAYVAEGRSEENPEEYYVFCFRADGSPTFSMHYVYSTSDYARDRKYLYWYDHTGVQSGYERWLVGLTEPREYEYNDITYDERDRPVFTQYEFYDGESEPVIRSYSTSYEELEGGAYRRFKSENGNTYDIRFDRNGREYYRRESRSYESYLGYVDYDYLKIHMNGVKQEFLSRVYAENSQYDSMTVKQTRDDGFQLTSVRGTGLEIPWNDVRLYSHDEIMEFYTLSAESLIRIITNDEGLLTEYYESTGSSLDIDRYQYNSNGQVTSRVVSNDYALGDSIRTKILERTTLEYDDDQRLVSEITESNANPDRNSDPVWFISHEKRLTYEDDGRLVRSESTSYRNAESYPDAGDETCKEYRYDEAGRLLHNVYCDDSYVEYYEYDEAGRFTQKLSGRMSDYNAVWVSYDELGRLVDYGEGTLYADGYRGYTDRVRVKYSGPTPADFQLDPELATYLTAPAVDRCISPQCLYDAGR